MLWSFTLDLPVVVNVDAELSHSRQHFISSRLVTKPANDDESASPKPGHKEATLMNLKRVVAPGLSMPGKPSFCECGRYPPCLSGR
jgi:hypothetical protein